MTQIFKCPKCGSDIEVTDTVLYEDSDIPANITRFRIDTALVHKQMMVDEDCLVIFRMLAEEQKQIIENVSKRAASFKWRQY